MPLSQRIHWGVVLRRLPPNPARKSILHAIVIWAVWFHPHTLSPVAFPASQLSLTACQPRLLGLPCRWGWLRCLRARCFGWRPRPPLAELQKDPRGEGGSEPPFPERAVGVLELQNRRPRGFSQRTFVEAFLPLFPNALGKNPLSRAPPGGVGDPPKRSSRIPTKVLLEGALDPPRPADF